MNWVESKESEIKWLNRADHFYIGARVLYWENILYICMFLGAHAIELYLKAFLIYKCGWYIEGHNLIELYNECRKLDTFFNDANVARYFEGHVGDASISNEQWADYRESLNYPEALPHLVHKRPKAFMLRSGDFMEGSTFESLDKIASFMHKTITIPQEKEDLIRNLIQTEDMVSGFLVIGKQRRDRILHHLFKRNPYLQNIYGYNQL